MLTNLSIHLPRIFKDLQPIFDRIFSSVVLATLVASLVFTLAPAQPAFAAGSFTVNSAADTHDSNTADGICADAASNCSLRAALEQADASGGTTTINIPDPNTVANSPSSDHHYDLTLGEITIGNQAEDITLNGTSTAGNTIINMTNTAQDRILLINPSGTTSDVHTTIQNVTFSGGNLTSDSYGGGAILAGGPNNSLSISGSVFTNNSAPNGNGTGGALNISGGGTVDITNSTFTNNSDLDTSNTGGGAVFFFLQNNVSGSLNISGSTFSGNSTAAPSSGPGGGGAIGIQTQGALGNTFAASITNSTFANNSASAGYGGGIFVENAFGSGGTVHVNFNRFNGNTASAAHGLAYINTAGSVDATNNWWSCNGNPTTPAPGCDLAGTFGTGSAGTLTVNPWIVLTNAASPNSINVGQSTTLTASFLQNSSSSVLTSAQVSALVGLPITWGTPVHGALSAQQTAIQSSGTATTTFTNDNTCNSGSTSATVDNGTATASVSVLCPDLSAVKSNNVSGSTTFPTGWTWTIHVGSSGTGPASFADTQTILTDNLPNSGLTYGSPSVANPNGVSGTINCSISLSDDLVCTASGPVTLATPGSFDVQFTVTPSTAGAFPNPRGGGICQVDPNNNVTESNEANNTCSDTVTVSAPATITSADNTTFTVGTPGSFNVTATGFPAPTLSESGALPANVTFDTGTGVLGGTPAASTGGVYNLTFSAHNGVGPDATQAFTLTIDEAPAITTQPTDQTVVSGNPVSFSAAASGFPAPTVQWQVSTDGGATFNNIPGATSTTLTFSAAASNDGYQYQAVFTNTAGTATTTAATLTVNVPPSVTTNPTNQMVLLGSSVSFTAAASGKPVPTVQWQLSTDGGTTFTDIPGATSTTLTFTPVLTDNGNQYRAVFTNTAGTATSTAATLTVILITLSPASLPNGLVGVSYHQTITANNGSAPYTFAVTSGALPTGLVLSSGGVLSGTPTAVGSFSFVVTATDAHSETGSQSYTIVVQYNFFGFFFPVRNPPAINYALAGGVSLLPFSLGGNRGLGILAAGSPVSQGIDCGTFAPLTPAVPIVSGGRTGLYFTPFADLYFYSWQTQRAWANSCRSFTLTLKDGTAHVAYFHFLLKIRGLFGLGQ